MARNDDNRPPFEVVSAPTLVHAPGGGAVVTSELDGLDPEAVLERIQRWQAVLDSLAKHAIRATRPRHWCQMGDAPWLTAPGAEVLISKCGLRIDYCDPPYDLQTGKDDRGDWALYTCRLRVSLAQWTSMVAEGHCSSRDSFFSRGGKLTLSAVDHGNLKQSAYSNALINGVCRLLGIRRLTWEDVAELTGGKVTEKNAGTGAAFERGRGGGVSKPAADKPATPDQRSRVWREWAELQAVDTRQPPDGTGPRFYAWAVGVLGGDESKRRADKWTEPDVHKLLEAIRVDREGGGLPVDDGGAPPDDGPPA